MATGPIDQLIGDWRWAGGFWVLPALLAIMAWVGIEHRSLRAPVSTSSTQMPRMPLRNPTAWLIALFFACNNLVFYALIIGFGVYRELTLAKLLEAARETVSDLGMIMLLIMTAGVLGYAMTIERAPQDIAGFVTTLTADPLLILLLVMGLLVVSGMFLEGAANILLVTPIVMPVLIEAGYDPVHMGVLIVSLINFGGLTPPVGVIMFTVCGILDCKTGAFTRAALPFFAAMLLFFALLVAFSGLTVWLPNQLM